MDMVGILCKFLKAEASLLCSWSQPLYKVSILVHEKDEYTGNVYRKCMSDFRVVSRSDRYWVIFSVDLIIDRC